jgi:hypothetical protein
MPRAVRQPATRANLANLTLEQLNARLDEVRTRQQLAGTSVVAKSYAKERALIERAREERFGVKAHGR